MHWLDPRVRCNKCGDILRDDDQSRCLGCNADFAEVGTWCEVQEWDETRKQGQTRYIWRGWVLGWGGLLATIYTAPMLWRGETDLVPYAINVMYFLGGYIIGRQKWRGAEQEYAAWMERQAKRASVTAT